MCCLDLTCKHDIEERKKRKIDSENSQRIVGDDVRVNG